MSAREETLPLARGVGRRIGASVLPYFGGAAAIWFVWELVVLFTHPSPAVLPTPDQTARAFAQLLRNGELLRDTWASLRRVLIAWALSALVAIPLGLWQGTSPAVERMVDPVVELLRPISPLAWIPMAILWFGISETGKVFIIFIATFFPILLNTVAAVKGVDPVLLRAGRVLGCRGPTAMFRRVVLPAAMPTILVGLRIAFGTGWAAIIAAELVAAHSGLGYLIADGMEILRSDHVLVGMITIGVLGVTVDGLFRLLGRWIDWGG